MIKFECLKIFILIQGIIESYRKKKNSGNQLKKDEKESLCRYDEVMQILKFAGVIRKEISEILTLWKKELKKKQEKDETSKRENEISKIRGVLTIQNIVHVMTDYEIREDFVSGSNGACKLEQNELDMLNKL